MKLINPEVRIETVNLCNSRCVTCPREKLTRSKMVMDNLHFAKLAGQAHDLGAEFITVFGFGEPLLDEDIAWKIGYCGVLDLKTFITTNASLLTTDRAIALLKAGLTKIRFSVNGLWDNYNKVHKGLNYDTTMRNITNFIALNKIRFNGRCEIDVVSTLVNDENIEKIKKFWRGKVDHIEIWKPHNWTDGRDYRKIERKKKTCGRPFSGPIQINCDGKMIICCFDYNARLTVGCTHRDSIENILKGDKYNTIRERHRTGDLKGLICEKCDQLNEYPESPLLYSTKDPECEIDKTSSMKFKVKEI